MSTCGPLAGLCTAVDTPARALPAPWCRDPGTHETPVPGGDGGLVTCWNGSAAGSRAERARRRGSGVLAQRQRIDMTRPTTMRPKPMAKFHALSETMNGMRSPAT